jgi:hypothetical protein
LGVARARRGGERAGVPLPVFFWFCHQYNRRGGKNQKKDFRSTPNACAPLTMFVQKIAQQSNPYAYEQSL